MLSLEDTGWADDCGLHPSPGAPSWLWLFMGPAWSPFAMGALWRRSPMYGVVNVLQVNVIGRDRRSAVEQRIMQGAQISAVQAHGPHAVQPLFGCQSAELGRHLTVPLHGLPAHELHGPLWVGSTPVVVEGDGVVRQHVRLPRGLPARRRADLQD